MWPGNERGVYEGINWRAEKVGVTTIALVIQTFRKFVYAVVGGLFLSLIFPYPRHGVLSDSSLIN